MACSGLRTDMHSALETGRDRWTLGRRDSSSTAPRAQSGRKEEARARRDPRHVNVTSQARRQHVSAGVQNGAGLVDWVSGRQESGQQAGSANGATH